MPRCPLARGDVHAAAKYVVATDNDVAQIDTNLVANLLHCQHRLVPREHLLSQTEIASQRTHHASKLNQRTVTRGLYDPAIGPVDRCVNQYSTVALRAASLLWSTTSISRK